MSFHSAEEKAEINATRSRMENEGLITYYSDKSDALSAAQRGEARRIWQSKKEKDFAVTEYDAHEYLPSHYKEFSE